MPVKLEVVTGNITSIPADALITTISSNYLWLDGINFAINSSSGTFYHSQLNGVELVDGKVILVRGEPFVGGRFKNVVFIVDDGEQELSDLIGSGLFHASRTGMESVLVPTIRSGTAVSAKKPISLEALSELVLGIRTSIPLLTKLISEITVVIHDENDTETVIKNMMMDIPTTVRL